MKNKLIKTIAIATVLGLPTLALASTYCSDYPYYHCVKCHVVSNYPYPPTRVCHNFNPNYRTNYNNYGYGYGYGYGYNNAYPYGYGYSDEYTGNGDFYNGYNNGYYGQGYSGDESYYNGSYYEEPNYYSNGYYGNPGDYSNSYYNGNEMQVHQAPGTKAPVTQAPKGKTVGAPASQKPLEQPSKGQQ